MKSSNTGSRLQANRVRKPSEGKDNCLLAVQGMQAAAARKSISTPSSVPVSVSTHPKEAPQLQGANKAAVPSIYLSAQRITTNSPFLVPAILNSENSYSLLHHMLRAGSQPVSNMSSSPDVINTASPRAGQPQYAFVPPSQAILTFHHSEHDEGNAALPCTQEKPSLASEAASARRAGAPTDSSLNKDLCNVDAGQQRTGAKKRDSKPQSGATSQRREVVVLMCSQDKQEQAQMLKSRDVLQNAFQLRKREPVGSRQLKLKVLNEQSLAKSRSSEHRHLIPVANTEPEPSKERQTISIRDQRSRDKRLPQTTTEKLTELDPSKLPKTNQPSSQSGGADYGYSPHVDTAAHQHSEPQSRAYSETSARLLPLPPPGKAYYFTHASTSQSKPTKRMLSVKTLQIRAPSPHQLSNEYILPYQLGLVPQNNQATVVSIDRSLIDRHRQIMQSQESLLQRSGSAFFQSDPYHQTASSFYPLAAASGSKQNLLNPPLFAPVMGKTISLDLSATGTTLHRSFNRTALGPQFAGFKRSDLPKYAKQRNTKPFINCRKTPYMQEKKVGKNSSKEVDSRMEGNKIVDIDKNENLTKVDISTTIKQNKDSGASSERPEQMIRSGTGSTGLIGDAKVETSRIKAVDINPANSYQQTQMLNRIDDYTDQYAQTSVMSSKQLKSKTSGARDVESSGERSVRQNVHSQLTVSPLAVATIHNSIQHKESRHEATDKAGGTPKTAEQIVQSQMKMGESLNTSNGAVDSMNFSPRRALQNLDSKIFMRNVLNDPRKSSIKHKGSSFGPDDFAESPTKTANQQCTFGAPGDQEATSAPLSHSVGDFEPRHVNQIQKSSQANVARGAQEKLLHLSEIAAGAIKESDNESQITSMQKTSNALLSKYPKPPYGGTSLLDSSSIQKYFPGDKKGDSMLKFILTEDSNDLMTLNKGPEALRRSEDQAIKAKSRQHAEMFTKPTVQLRDTQNAQEPANVILSSQSSLAHVDGIEVGSTPALEGSDRWRHNKSVTTARQGCHNQSRMTENANGVDAANDGMRRETTPNQQYWENPAQIQEREIEIQNKSLHQLEEQQPTNAFNRTAAFTHQIAQKSFMFNFDGQANYINQNISLKDTHAQQNKTTGQLAGSKRLPLRDRSLNLRSRSKSRAESRQSQEYNAGTKPTSKATIFLNLQKKKRMQQIHLEMKADRASSPQQPGKRGETDGSTIAVEQSSQDATSLLPKLQDQPRNSTPDTQLNAAAGQFKYSRKFASRELLKPISSNLNYSQELYYVSTGAIQPHIQRERQSEQQRSDPDIDDNVHCASFGALGHLQEAGKTLNRNSDHGASKSMSEERFRITHQPVYWQAPRAPEQSAHYSSLLGVANEASVGEGQLSINDIDAVKGSEVEPSRQSHELDSRVSNILTKTGSKALYKYAVVTNSPNRKQLAQRDSTQLRQEPIEDGEYKSSQNIKDNVQLLQQLSETRKRKTTGAFGSKIKAKDQVRALSPYGEMKKRSTVKKGSLDKYSAFNLLPRSSEYQMRHLAERPSIVELARHLQYLQPSESLYPASSTSQLNTDFEHLRAKQRVQSDHDLLRSQYNSLANRKLTQKGIHAHKQMLQRNMKSTAAMGRRMPARIQYSKVISKQQHKSARSHSSSSASDVKSSYRASLKVTQEHLLEHEMQARLNQSGNQASTLGRVDGAQSNSYQTQTQPQFFKRPIAIDKIRTSNKKEQSHVESTQKTYSAQRSTKRSLGQQHDLLDGANTSVIGKLAKKRSGQTKCKFAPQLKPRLGISAGSSQARKGHVSGQRVSSSGSGQVNMPVISQGNKRDVGQVTEGWISSQRQSVTHIPQPQRVCEQANDQPSPSQPGLPTPVDHAEQQPQAQAPQKPNHQLPSVLQRAQKEARLINERLSNLTDPLKIGTLKNIYQQYNPAPILLHQSKFHKLNGQLNFNRSISQGILPMNQESLVASEGAQHGPRPDQSQEFSLYKHAASHASAQPIAGHRSSFNLRSRGILPRGSQGNQYQPQSKTNPASSPFVNPLSQVQASSASPPASSNSYRRSSRQALKPTLLHIKPSSLAGVPEASQRQNLARHPYTADYTQLFTNGSASDEILEENSHQIDNAKNESSRWNGHYPRHDGRAGTEQPGKPSELKVSMKSSQSRDAVSFSGQDRLRLGGVNSSLPQSRDAQNTGEQTNNCASTQYISLNQSYSLQTQYRRIHENAGLRTLSRQGEGRLGAHAGGKENPDVSGSQQRNSTNSGMSGVRHLMMIVDLVDKSREQDDDGGDVFLYPEPNNEYGPNTDLDFASFRKNSTISN